MVGCNVVQMGDAQAESGQIFPEFLVETRALLIKARGDFHSSADKTSRSNSRGGRWVGGWREGGRARERESETAMLYFVFIKGRD